MNKGDVTSFDKRFKYREQYAGNGTYTLAHEGQRIKGDFWINAQYAEGCQAKIKEVKEIKETLAKCKA